MSVHAVRAIKERRSVVVDLPPPICPLRAAMASIKAHLSAMHSHQVVLTTDTIALRITTAVRRHPHSVSIPRPLCSQGLLVSYTSSFILDQNLAVTFVVIKIWFFSFARISLDS